MAQNEQDRKLEDESCGKTNQEFNRSQTVLQTDDSITFLIFEDFIDVHVKGNSSTKEGEFNLEWAYKAISYLKSILAKY